MSLCLCGCLFLLSFEFSVVKNDNEMYIIGITGASGPILGIRLIEELLSSGKEVGAIASATALRVMGHEIFGGHEEPKSIRQALERRGVAVPGKRFVEFANDDLFSPPASGSFRTEAVIIIPCSMKTLSALAAGHADSLMTRAFDVALKERRRAVVVPRETPLSAIHLENMLRLSRAGADILPPVPAFYSLPNSLEDMINFIVGKVLGLLDIDHALFKPWGGRER